MFKRRLTSCGRLQHEYDCNLEVKSEGEFFLRTKHQQTQTRKTLHQKKKKKRPAKYYLTLDQFSQSAGWFLGEPDVAQLFPAWVKQQQKNNQHYSDSLDEGHARLKNAHRVILDSAKITMITAGQQRMSPLPPRVPLFTKRTLSFPLLAPNFSRHALGR